MKLSTNHHFLILANCLALIGSSSSFVIPTSSTSSKIGIPTIQSKTTTTTTTTTTTPNYHNRRHSTVSLAASGSGGIFDEGSATSSGMVLQGLADLILDAIGGGNEDAARNLIVKPTPLMDYFLQAVIDSAVPAIFTIITIAFAAFFFNKSRAGAGGSPYDDDFNTLLEQRNAVDELYDDLYGPPPSKSASPFGPGGFGPPGRSLNKAQLRNIGIPEKEYIKVTNLNDKYASYDFSLTKATTSKAAAAAQFREQAFGKALSKALNSATSSSSSSTTTTSLPAYAQRQLLDAEKQFVQKGRTLIRDIQLMEAQLIKAEVTAEMIDMGMETPIDPEPLNTTKASSSNDTNITTSTDTNDDDDDGSNSLSSMFGSNNNNNKDKTKKEGLNKKQLTKLNQDISKLQTELRELELDFIRDVTLALGPERAVGFRSALVGDVAARGIGGLLTQLQDRPLSALLKQDVKEEEKDKSLFVMKFPGDVSASQLNELREEVTAIIRNAKPGDEALLVLQSGGGTVTGYGLAAGQLVRLRNSGIFLTIAVEQVAASGGYMMSCVADRIIASPFAVLGSIGVISEIPNAYERLKQEGIEFQTVTAGEFKRTLTPTKKVTKDDVKKAKEDVEMILTQFSGFVQKNRPKLDVASVATGETWFGEAALEKGLCDEIKPVDDILLEYVDLGYNVYEIAYSPPPPVPQGLAGLLPVGQEAKSVGGYGSSNNPSIGRRMIRWLVSTVSEEVQQTMIKDGGLDLNIPTEQKYRVEDDIGNRIKLRD